MGISVVWKALVGIGTAREDLHERTCRQEATPILAPRLENNPAL
ncbi:hypothetical protein [Aminirod propionatiphilus]